MARFLSLLFIAVVLLVGFHPLEADASDGDHQWESRPAPTVGTRGEQCTSYLFHSVVLKPYSLGPGQEALLEVRVTNCYGEFVKAVPVSVVSQHHSAVIPPVGSTDDEGRFTATYEAPAIRPSQEDELTVTLVNEDGSELRGEYRVLLLAEASGEPVDPVWMIPLAATIAVVVAVATYRWRSKR